MPGNTFELRTTPTGAHKLQNQSNIDLLQLLRTLWRNKYSILALTAAVAGIASVVAINLTPIYRATAVLQISDKNAKVVSFDQSKTTADAGAANQYLETQFELLKSRAIASRVVATLDLSHHPEFNPTHNFGLIARMQARLAAVGIGSPATAKVPPTEAQVQDLVASRFLDRVQVEQLGKSQLVQIQVDMADAQAAAQAANTLTAAYMEGQLNATVGVSNTATAWMNSRLGELAEVLKESEDRLQAYREAEKLVDVQGVSTISASELSLTGERMIDARRQRAEAESQYRQVQKMSAGGWEKLASVPAVLADPVVQKFKAEKAKAQAKVDELSSRYGDRHPAMEAARSDLTAASASLRSQVEQVVAGIERAYQLAVANEGSLQSSFDANKSQIQDISRKEFKLRELQREVDGNRALYDTFMTRLRETTATSDLDTAYIRVVDQAVAPTAPIKPKKSLLVALAALIGLLIGCVLTLIREALNPTFRSVEQVESILEVPLLGVVPKVKGSTTELARMFSNDKRRTFAEAISTIRTGVLMNDTQRAQKVVLVTSTVPGEGRTTVAVNLAVAFGQLERVLLIDADFRRSRLTATFGLPVTTPGLGNLLEGNAPLPSCVNRINDIDVLCIGTASARPLELLASGRFRALLKDLGEHYDRIIIDSPPLHAVSDAIMLSGSADAVIYVVRADATSRTRATKALQRLQHNHANISGVVLNQVDIRKAASGGYSYDGFYDYFGYSAPGSPKLSGK